MTEREFAARPRTERRSERRPGKLGEALAARGVSRQAIEDAIAAQREGDPRHLGEILVERRVIRPDDVRHALDRQRESADSSLRVHIGLLDQLTNATDELVRARDQVLELSESSHRFRAACRRLDAVTAALQEQVLQTRLEPIGNAFRALPRVARELARACEKRVRLELHGCDTEIDRTVLGAIADPLVHLVRNGVDHGIEARETRIAAGKPDQGVVAVRAHRAGDRVHVQITDDGAGIDVDRLREEAVERDLIAPQRARSMSEREAIRLVFARGLSTAASVTPVSGLGVGMDVVQTAVEGAGGTIDVQSSRGTGTRIELDLPRTAPSAPRGFPRWIRG